MMVAGYLASHLMTQHERVAETRWIWITPSAGAGPQTFWMAFPSKGGLQSCLVERCLGRAATRTAMRVHFLDQHVLDTVVILEGGNLPHSWCTLCDMLVPRRDLKGRHPGISQCDRGAERKRRRLAEAEMRESSERSLEAYMEPLENITTFRYLGRVLTVGDDEWLKVVGNLGKL